MIEAPEAKLLSEQLERTLRGKTIVEVATRSTPHRFAWFCGTDEEYSDLLTGQMITGARFFGGQVLVEAGSKDMLFSDGVNFRFIAPGGKLPSRHQLLLGFDDDSCLTVSVRMYGVVYCYERGALDDPMTPYFESARNKPQVMSDDFCEEYFMSLFKDPASEKKSLKAFLATGQTIPGLGNGVLQDILYNAGLNPRTNCSETETCQRKKLYSSIRETLTEIYLRGGRNTESDIFGIKGGYVPFLSKDTAGSDCVRCASGIVKENYLGGSIYYCPVCQPRPEH